MIRRWWQWRVELARLRRDERRTWSAYARAHLTYAEAVATHGYPAALPEAEDLERAAQVAHEAARLRDEHEERGPQ